MGAILRLGAMLGLQAEHACTAPLAAIPARSVSFEVARVRRRFLEMRMRARVLVFDPYAEGVAGTARLIGDWDALGIGT